MAAPKPIFIVVTQKAHGDCAVAALACLLQVPYEEVLVVAAQIVPLVLGRGLDGDEMVKIARRFGRVLEEREGSEIDYKHATGILGARLKHNSEGEEHAVVLSRGLVFDPEDGKVWAVRDYLRAYQARDVDLLELEG